MKDNNGITVLHTYRSTKMSQKDVENIVNSIVGDNDDK